VLLGIPQEAEVRNHDCGKGAPPLGEPARVIQPTHRGIGGSE
jgi:hypothetical protein